MAKVWAWILVGVIALAAVIWLADYSYRYGGMCRDDRGYYYSCEKTSTYRNAGSYAYYDNYGNRVVVDRTTNYDNDNYYNCYHYMMQDSRYGQLLRNSGFDCSNYYSDYSSYNNYYTVQTASVEKPPIIYVN